MNKVYNTVWCASRGMWVVTSELVRKGGQRPRQIRRTVLAGLIASLLVPQSPLLAASYDNQTLQNSSVTLNDGDTANTIILNSGGILNISSGGSASSNVVINGRENVYDGGITTGTSINGGASFSAAWGDIYNVGQVVYSGGSAASAVVNQGGAQVVNGGTVTSATINNNGLQYVGAGSVAGVVIRGVQEIASLDNAYVDKGEVKGAIVESGGAQNIRFGTATDTILNNGYQFVDGGGSIAIRTTVNSGGVQTIDFFGNAQNSVINSSGKQIIYLWGEASDATVNEGGIQTVGHDGSATGTIINFGGQQFLNDHDMNDISPPVPVTKGGYASNTVINSGGVQHVQSKGSASDTTINSGGQQFVSSGGSVILTTIDGGGQHVLDGGSVSDTTINSGGQQFVSSGGSAAQTTIDGGGQHVLDGGSISDTTINSGGQQFVSSGGSATLTTIDGGEQHVLDGGNASDTTINSGGRQLVSSGGSAMSTTANSGGGLTVLTGGDATNITINSGGSLGVGSGGSATAITQNSGGAVLTNTSAVLEGINRNGSFAITGGSAGNMLLENGGVLSVYDTHEATDTWVDRGGSLLSNSGSVLKGSTTVTGDGTLAGPEVNNQGHLRYLNNSAAVYNGNLTGTGDLTVEGGSLTLGGTLSQDGGVFIHSGGSLNMDHLQTRVDVTAQSGTTLNLMNGSTLTGRILNDGTGGGDVSVAGSSVWRLTGDSTVGALSVSGGTIDFHDSGTSVPRVVTLNASTLSGSGTFLMNTDIAAYSGDLLNVSGNASGNFALGIRNTGQEPVSAGAPLRVVHTGGGDAQFTLNGGKVDAGTWEYYLSRENTYWYLSPDIPQEVNPDVPPEIRPEAPAGRQTTASTDAVLNIASAPVYIFNQELQNLRFRRGDVVQNSPVPGGAWGRYLGSDTRISGAAGSGYKLHQSGFETGGDKVFELDDSRLAVGAFFSFTDNRISHARGGSSDVDSTGGGLYATWADNSGLYVDGVAKVNHFSNKLQTQMSDSTPVRGNYSQNGYGVSLEVGKTFRLSEDVWTEPYILGRAFRVDGTDVRLDNGMKARVDTTKSLQAEAGVSVGMNLDVGGTVVKPYLMAAVSHEFADNNNVRINDSHDFRNDISGTTGKYGLGVSAQPTPNAGVWAEARYENGRHTESPVTASIGFRINF